MPRGLKRGFLKTNSYFMKHNFKIGDILKRAKGPWSRHYMVYVGKINGIECIAENQAGVGVQYLPLSNAQKIIASEKFTGTEYERLLVRSKIDELIGTNYDLVNFNCEHFARKVTTGKTHSKQVDTACLFFFGIGIAGLLVSKNPGLRTLAGLIVLIAIIVAITQPKEVSKTIV